MASLTLVLPTGRISARMAEPQDAAILREFLAEHEFAAIDCDWSLAAPFWILAERDSQIIGCLNICYSLPIGRLGNLVIRDDLDGVRKARVFWELISIGCTWLYEYGCDCVTVTVPDTLDSYQKALQKRGGVMGDAAHVLFARIRSGGLVRDGLKERA